MSSLPRPRRAAFAVIGAFVALELAYAIWVAFIGHSAVGPRVGYGPDSAVYITAARAPVWSRDFLAGPGAFGFLALAKLCARNLRAIVMVQSVISIGAWTLLATTAAGIVRSNVARWVALIAILGVGLAPGVVQWNAFITTESLSISLLCVVLALGLRVVLRGTQRDLILFLIAIFGFAFTRDTNALVVGALAIVALVVAAVRPRARTRGLSIGAAGLVLMLTATSLSNAAQPPRWYWPLAETTSIRLLADPGATRYLVDHGFPLDEETRSLPTRYIFIVFEVKDGASFASFRRWVRVEGRRVYLEYLVTHPGRTLWRPFDDRKAFFDFGVVEGYSNSWYRNHPGGPYAVIGAVAAPHFALLAELWSIAAVVALAVLFRRRRQRALLGAVTLSGVVAVLGYYAAWHGDALEVYRHALTATVGLRLTLWFVTILVVDAVVERARPGERDSAIGMPGESDLDDEEHGRAPDHDERGDLSPPASGTDQTASGTDQPVSGAG